MALASSSRGGARIRVVVLHTAEGARNKEDLYAFFNRTQNASSHAGIDARGIATWVPDHRAAWTLRGGNPYSLNAELCAFAGWSRSEWLSTGTVNKVVNPRQLIRNAAEWARRECDEHNIPKRWLTVAQFRAGWSGIIDHDTYTDATGDGTHWDVGEGFPVDVFMSDLLEGDDEEMAQADVDRIIAIVTENQHRINQANDEIDRLREDLNQQVGSKVPGSTFSTTPAEWASYASFWANAAYKRVLELEEKLEKNEKENDVQ